MRSLPCSKTVMMIAPALVDNTSGTAIEVDTKDFKFGRITFAVGATDIAMSALKLTECDTSGGSYTDVTGTVFGTATNIAGSTSSLPADDDDGKLWQFDVDLRGRKRFLKLVATAGNGSLGTNMCAIIDLFGGSITPTSTTSRGAEEILRV